MRKKTMKSGLILSMGILIIAGVQSTVPAETFPIARAGRKIMHDGFLMEWSLKTAQPWTPDSSWIWDAIRTPDGLCGYVRLHKMMPCSAWTVTFSSSVDSTISISIPGDSVSPFFEVKTDYSSYKSEGIAVMEWVFPMDTTKVKSPTDSLILRINAKCSSGDTLPELRLACRQPDSKKNGYGKLTGRGIIIGLLAVMYLMVQRRIKRQTAQKESPHQST